MDSHNKVIFILIVFLIPVISLAQMLDFLLVSGTFLNGAVNIESIEQRVFNSRDVSIFKSGSYEIRLYEKNKLISSNFFEIIENAKSHIYIGEDISHVDFRGSGGSIFVVKLPLAQQIKVEDSTVEVRKGSQPLLTKKLAEVPATVLSVQTNELVTPERLESSSVEQSKRNNLVILSLVGIGTVLAGWYFWKRKNKKDNDAYIH